MEENVTQISADEARNMEQNCKDLIKVADAMERLLNHADFKLVFMEEYLKKEPARMTMLLAEQSWNMDADKKPIYREDINEKLIGIARFHEYIRKVFAMGDQAQNQLNSLAEAKVVYEQE